MPHPVRRTLSWGLLVLAFFLAGPVQGAPRRGVARSVRTRRPASLSHAARVRPPVAALLRAGHAVAVPAEPEKAALEIPGLRTPAEVAQVTLALQQLPGVQSAVIDLRTRLAVVDFNPRVTQLARVLGACAEVGFEANEYRVENRFPKPIKLKGG